MTFRDPEIAPKGGLVSEQWDLTQASKRELFIGLRDEALDHALKLLKHARGGDMSESEFTTEYYSAAETELAFVRYWDEQLRETPDQIAPDPQDPTDS